MLVSILTILCVLRIINTNYTYLLSSVTKEQSQLFVTEHLSMVGCLKTSTLGAIREAPPSLCSRLKMVTASEASPPPPGHLTTNVLVIMRPCSSTYPNKFASHIPKKPSVRSSVTVSEGHTLVEVKSVNWVHTMNHLTEKGIADRGIITLALT